MFKNHRIKMGLKIVKVLLLVLVVSFLLTANSTKRVKYEIINFNLNKSLSVETNAVKEEEKQEVVVPKVEEKEKKVEKKPVVKKTKPKVVTERKVDTSSNKPSATTVKTLSGSLTGYSADCPACTGKLACKSSYNVYKNGVVTYNDKKFGNVRIVASSRNLACGSIIKFKLSTVSSQPIYAVVLDRGVRGNDIDLLMANSSDARKKVGRRNVTYEVLRTGW